MKTEKTAGKQGGFRRGQSGNPQGRPKGALNKATLACQALLDGEAENITRAAIKKALDGDMMAVKLCMERIVPPRKERMLNVDLPSVRKDADLHKFTAQLLRAVSEGQITISEAQGLAALGGLHVRAMGQDLFLQLGYVE